MSDSLKLFLTTSLAFLEGEGFLFSEDHTKENNIPKIAQALDLWEEYKDMKHQFKQKSKAPEI